MNVVVAPPLRVAILGGGISGLAAAWYLHRQQPGVQVVVFESGTRWGGVIRTEHCDGFLVEHSADMLSTLEPWAVELCQQLGMAEELVSTDERYRRAFVVRKSRLYPVPEGFALLEPRRLWPLLRSPLLSPWGKLRLAAEFFVPPRRASQDESLAEFATRRFGREVFQRLVQPLISGIYTADPYKLSMQATLSRFVMWEKTYGSLIRASWRLRRKNAPKGETADALQGAGARYGAFVAPRQGMQSLIDTLVRKLPPHWLHLERCVLSVIHVSNKWKVVWKTGDQQPTSDTFDAVIVALPPAQAAAVLRALDGQLAEQLYAIPTASVAIAVLGIARQDIAHPLNGFGFVAPLQEKRPVLAGSFSSVKFPGRAPQGFVLMRLFLGGTCQPELLDYDDRQLLDLAKQELTELLGFRGTPRLEKLIRWQNAMPQYHVGHVQRVATIEERLAKWPRLALAGNAYHGVGIPWCVRSGQRAAASVVAAVTGSPPQTNPGELP